MSPTTALLRPAHRPNYNPTQVTLLGSGSLQARFDLTAIPLGIYDVQVIAADASSITSAGAFEITARRGVTHVEMQQLLSKLGLHRMSVYGSHLGIIKGGKRYRLGPLAEINLKYLTELVEECIDQYGSCGLEITESRAGSGAAGTRAGAAV